MIENIKNKVLISNIIVSILFLLPIFKLDFLSENYSTLTLNSKGYLYVLFIGILIGMILFYETKIISNKKYAYIILFSMIIGVLIPHRVPYNLQGNLHLVCAYLGFVGIITITYINIYLSLENKNLLSIYTFCLLCALLLFIKANMVNTLSEAIVMISTLYMNYYLFKKRLLIK